MTKQEEQQVTDWRNRFATELRRLHSEDKSNVFTDKDIEDEIKGLDDAEILYWVKDGVSPEQSAEIALM